MKALEWKWGLIIGAANMAWLFGSYGVGLHNRGIGMVQVIVVMGVMITLLGFIFALRAITRAEPETTFYEGVRSGGVIAFFSAAIAVLAQLLYLKWINPGWTEYMVAETRTFFAARGSAADLVESMALQAEKTFGLGSYVTQAGAGAFIQGLIFSAIIMGVIRWQAKR